jgi:hypothetical protein
MTDNVISFAPRPGTLPDAEADTEQQQLIEAQLKELLLANRQGKLNYILMVSSVQAEDGVLLQPWLSPGSNISSFALAVALLQNRLNQLLTDQ